MMEVQLHIFLISALHGSNWPALCPCSLTSGKEPQYPLTRRLGGPHSRSKHCRYDMNPFLLLGMYFRFFGHSFCSLFYKSCVLWQKFINVVEETVVSSFYPEDGGSKFLWNIHKFLLGLVTLQLINECSSLSLPGTSDTMFVVDLLVSVNDDKITNSPLLNSSMRASSSQRSSGIQRCSDECFRHAHAERYTGQIHHCGLYQQAALT